MSCRWKNNWAETQQHFRQWWNGRGLVLNLGDFPVTRPTIRVIDPGEAVSPAQKHSDAAWVAARSRALRANRNYDLGDILPVAFVDWGTVSLAAYLGAEVTMANETIWYHPRPDEPTRWGPLRFDPESEWFRIHAAIYRQSVQAAGSDFVVGQPGIGANLEVLAALRGGEALMADLLDNPGWVHEKLWEINQAFLQPISGFTTSSGCRTGAVVIRTLRSGGRGRLRW